MKNNGSRLLAVLLLVTAFGVTTRLLNRQTIPIAVAAPRENYPQLKAPVQAAELQKLRFRLAKPQERLMSKKSDSSSQRLGRIKDELVVLLPKGMGLDDLKRMTGIKAEEIGKIESLNAYRLRFSSESEADQARAMLEAQPQLATVEDNRRLGKPEVSQAGDGTAVMEKNSLRLGDANGQLIVGLVDSNVQRDGSGLGDFLLPSISVAGEASSDPKDLEHGTAMASAILQGMNMVMAPGSEVSARVLPVDVYGDSETTTSYQVAQGVAAAVEAGATVINLSLGSETESFLLQDIIHQASDQGVVFLAAAGNTPTTQSTYPAAYEEVIAVTSVDYDGAISSYANYGDFVDVGTPGSIVVDYNGSRQLVTGTSVSTALATGITVGLADSQKSSASKVEKSIRQGLAVH